MISHAILCYARLANHQPQNFSLLTLKESLDVEHLTRITLLLTKFTILFLPGSLVMAYFSVPLERVGEYTLAEFWISFSLVFLLSWAALVGFGIASGSLQTGWVWKSVVKGTRGVGRWVGRGA